MSLYELISMTASYNRLFGEKNRTEITDDDLAEYEDTKDRIRALNLPDVVI